MTRLLVVSDAGGNTGFERVMRGISDYLQGSGKYDITVRGIGYDPGHSVREYTYPVKPAAIGDNPLGTHGFGEWIAKDRADAVLTISDLWNITNYHAYKPQDLPSIAYFPVDTPNMKALHCMGLGAITEAATYTYFGAMEAASGTRRITDQIFEAFPEIADQELSWAVLPKENTRFHIHFDRFRRYQNPEGFNIIPHGMDKGLFEPRSKREARALFGIPQTAFVVSNVNTNQFRKRQDLTLRAFKLLVDKNPNAFLLLHCAGGDRDGWDLFDMVHYLKIPTDRVACVHYSNPFLTDDQLCWLYNTADVNINTGGGEGWGQTSSESAACGIPQMVPDWSATRELWVGHGTLLPVADYRAEPKRLNTMHAVVDVQATADLLQQFSESTELLEQQGALALEFAKTQPTWDEVGAMFERVVDRAINAPAPNSVTKSDLLADRDPTVRSELEGCALW